MAHLQEILGPPDMSVLPASISGHLSLEQHLGENEQVMQVLVVHLDLFTCGTCGKQSTDLVDHMLHKTNHPVSTMYTCELCKGVYHSRQSLLHHYGDHHSLTKLLEQALDEKTTEQLLVVADDKHILSDKQGNGQILPWKVEEDLKAEEHITNGDSTTTSQYVFTDLQHDLANNLLLHDHGVFCEKEKKDLTGNKETSSSKSSSRARSKQLLKTAKRTLTHTLVSPFSTSPAISRTMSRKPPILQRRPLAISETRKSAATSLVSPQKPKVRRKSGNSTEAERCLMEFVDKGVAPPLAVERNLELNEELQCLHCDFGSQNKDEVSIHMSTKHKHVLELSDNLQIPAVEESPVKKEKSDICPSAQSEKKLHRKGRQPRKMERQDLPGVYLCNQCGKSFQRLRYLRKHAHVHKTEKSFVCDECGKLFRCKGYLKVHQKKMHEGVERLFRCNQCDFTSSINAAIHAHRQIHSQGSVLCDICGYAYTDKATLAKHKRVHDPRRPFACNFTGCTWRFKTEIMCKAHIRNHTTEGKFRCSYCGYVFRHKHHLQRHEANMHGIKHEKSRQHAPKSSYAALYNSCLSHETEDSVNIIVSTDFTSEGLDLGGDLPNQFLVIQPEGDISYETAPSAMTYGVADGHG